MLFGRKAVSDPYFELADKIRQEIMLSLQKKGVKLSNIHIDLKADSVNVSISISKDQDCCKTKSGA